MVSRWRARRSGVIALSSCWAVAAWARCGARRHRLPHIAFSAEILTLEVGKGLRVRHLVEIPGLYVGQLRSAWCVWARDHGSISGTAVVVTGVEVVVAVAEREALIPARHP
jgi:hypothetical protein